MFFYTSYRYSRFEVYMEENPALTCISSTSRESVFWSTCSPNRIVILYIIKSYWFPFSFLSFILTATHFLERNKPKTCAYTVLFLIVLTPSFTSQNFVTDGNRFAIYHSYNCHILPNRLHVIPSLTIDSKLILSYWCFIPVLAPSEHMKESLKTATRKWFQTCLLSSKWPFQK